jgi:uncharacterized protein
LPADVPFSNIEARAWGYEYDRIIPMGESLGTGVAIPLAATHEAAALVLDSPFSSAVDVAAVHYRMLPVRWLMFDQFRSDSRFVTFISRF